MQDKHDAVIPVLEQYGPQLGQPHVDTLAGSAHANMKEIRVKGQGGWRLCLCVRHRPECCGPGRRRQERPEPTTVLQDVDCHRGLAFRRLARGRLRR
ncbi:MULTISPECIES: type II toxin-antitoxin system RelE/ParE family toxin [unclassified Roseobacter]|uniref:type II toxin-antitoxin system RelE/ParE family toxin n=1 Tax=unclassified Roseobacter TaxID=196798 RepID=UPI0034614CB5